ncbi:hypothetical protein F070042J6_33920 [Bacteroides sp. f07]
MIHNIILIGENIVYQTSFIFAKVWRFLVYLRTICAIESSFCAGFRAMSVKNRNKAGSNSLSKP